jgi:CRP/FNR family transcriptional regulator
MSDRAEQLRSIPLFAGLEEDALEQVAAVCSEFEAPEGLVLTEPSQPGAGMFVITEGRASVQARNRQTELGPGDFFGELALFTADAKRTARVCAETDVRGFALARTDLERLLKDEPRLAIALLGALAERLDDATA